MNRKNYKKLFQAFLPKGPAWSREEGSNMGKLAEAVGSFFFYIHTLVEQTIFEMFPSSANKKLKDWEREYDIDQIIFEEILQTRKNNLSAKINRKFNPTTVNFINLAKILGKDIKIKTYSPTRCGFLRCGEKLGGNTKASYHWIVEVKNVSIIYARCKEAVCGKTLCKISISNLEQIFNEIKPAHTVLTFNYI